MPPDVVYALLSSAMLSATHMTIADTTTQPQIATCTAAAAAVVALHQ
jgi:hypothetical protein